MRVLLLTLLWLSPLIAIIFYDLFNWCRDYRNGYRRKNRNYDLVFDVGVIIMISYIIWNI